MTRTTTVRVTADHITAGGRDTIRYCPVTLALRDAFNASEAQAGATVYAVILNRPPGLLRGTLPPAVTAFINDYDDGRPVEPFTFAIGKAASAPGGAVIFPGPACGHPMRPFLGFQGPCERPAGHPGYHRRIRNHGRVSYLLGCRCATCSNGFAAYSATLRVGGGNHK
jgi:hypothetical protein